ncbi:MAG TPA: FADH(2)-oxidizing methylenetetrahydrofolate--tRNA-(uracil(54)-C(5))-methyltransferase TrmFO [Clostridia bacterium]|nr:FADH(2)-oxidizing methylenetetrahydrofolate--tRNA-(uracil(54)-C(5))-methyltransferase TrmFO [Clostridia bacterium]
MRKLVIVGAGLAGAEAAWQAAKRGVRVELWEMRPEKMTPAHRTGWFAELVCSNSLKAKGLDNASGLLKEEMRLLDSLIIRCADKHQVPAGGALAVDREDFSREVTEVIKSHPRINVVQAEVTEIPHDRPVIIATGPLTGGKLAEAIKTLTGEDYFYFFDAASPIVTLESINQSKVFKSSRYGKGEADYINCPMTEEEYEVFYRALLEAEEAPKKEFEREIYFEGCMPVEVLARRGKQTLLYGPLKPVGLVDPRTGKEPFAVVQLRQDNKEGTLYNLVGFQTNLKWPEQKRVFSLIPGLEEAEFVRYGVMHRNSFINAPKLLDAANQLKSEKGLFFAGQLTGVEGYVESAASGLVAGINAARWLQGLTPLVFPVETAIGALHHYLVSTPVTDFQPMGINFGLLPPLDRRIKDKRERNKQISQRALINLQTFIENNGI